jgi:hypothetical protein
MVHCQAFKIGFVMDSSMASIGQAEIAMGHLGQITNL